MKKNNLDSEYWENRYLNEDTAWDLDQISKPIKEYIDQLENKKIKILIPGAGNSYEAEYLWNIGFKNVYVLDIAKKPIDNLIKRVSHFPYKNCLVLDFFELKSSFDLIIEQTFFCALNPSLRNKYVSKTSDLLKPNGKLIGLFFDFPLTEIGPPYGGEKSIYKNYFTTSFKIKTLETAYNSVQSRKDKELFFIFEKK